MRGTTPKREALTKELEFLNSGGYRLVMGWRPPLVFEDSPICPKTPCSACPDAQCVLLDFVPEESRDKVIPCRHIPLNERGENLHPLYHTARMDEIEDALRKWLKKKIEELEPSAGAGTVLARNAAAEKPREGFCLKDSPPRKSVRLSDRQHDSNVLWSN